MKRFTVSMLVLLTIFALLCAGCGASAAPATPTAPAAKPAQTTQPASAVTGSTALAISGAVETPMQWSLADLKAIGTVKLDLVHPKLGKGTYEGVRFSNLLSLAKPTANAKTLTFISSDGYKTDVPLADVLKCSDCLVAIDSAGALSAAMPIPGIEGAAWAKLLTKIEVK
jgi:DMSO/TMAO reductase YedYZ molybdopterin-dependent catalytic subunit